MTTEAIVTIIALLIAAIVAMWADGQGEPETDFDEERATIAEEDEN